jgi:hypothetical protein
VPDYVIFSKELASIFDVGYPHEILDKAATIALEFFNITQRTIRQEREESWVKFQKFKLLFAFAREHMPEPARPAPVAAPPGWASRPLPLAPAPRHRRSDRPPPRGRSLFLTKLGIPDGDG